MRFLQNYTKNILLGVFLVALFGTTATIQTVYDKNVSLKNFFEAGTTKYILPTLIIKNFSFGFNNVLADVYWINSIQDFADWNKKDTFYIDEFRNLTTLDPKFSYPYLFGILTVTSKKYPELLYKIEPITKTGIDTLPYNWEIPFYLATGFNLTKNYPKALEYIEIAVSRPIIPIVVQKLYESYSKKRIALDKTSGVFIKTIYDTTKSEDTKEILKKGILITEIKESLERIIIDYKKKYGEYPKSLEDIAKKNMIELSPALTTEFDVIINNDTGSVEVLPKNR